MENSINVKGFTLLKQDYVALDTDNLIKHDIYINTNLKCGICEKTDNTNIFTPLDSSTCTKNVDIGIFKYLQGCNDIEINKSYTLWKNGSMYYTHGIVKNIQNNKIYVLYQALYGKHLYYIRQYEEFISKVPENRDSDNKTKQTYRFELVK